MDGTTPRRRYVTIAVEGVASQDDAEKMVYAMILFATTPQEKAVEMRVVTNAVRLDRAVDQMELARAAAEIRL